MANWRTTTARHFTGELLGTAILVFFGCGSVAVSVLFDAFSGLWQIAMIWGGGVTLAIYATRHLSCAHLNPAVSLAMAVSGRMKAKLLPAYIAAQLLGAFLAAALLYLLFSDSIAHFEQLHGIVRGTPASLQTAMMFGEFYPNPGVGNVPVVSTLTAFAAEALGTFILVFMIFSLTEGCNPGRPDNAQAPLFIGATVAIIIAVLAPLTQAGLNPARDLSPRLFSMLAGWGQAALPDASPGLLTVYVLGPVAGGLLAGLVFTRIVEPMMNGKPCENCE
ncbi:MAG: aquaporin [Zetaproteobacteria bacterium CG06_land_8_20_14_3_00_59_53]|nr:MAG: aquaporin [Zetaproteobacteria bacterium CG23_combo_of_CG06-09_8_20_14_all_59_86]PIQ66073.1 MAG: aquaporin [Zetaproteobacteria bacterium CG11_big_fil_rev_8_21_14_0_20_59_439]PIU71609.1 MAG: aquaporin [Zetaproteobacteria bacterium CG06_land_8_20_14_3_00_59_53]PIU97926.1 MAG: aquaporin [Zetaproteobacteria bacterium CG03_land_8_20_14_0_80_59_51]PIY45856.1 MAG: aquaporin [Zetaproteobacteria bacterium CG_4_10_14_0_8_um_filter_59_127]PJC16644.1 MAG: aquaporin [Zetaproteobacteria bacterium CG_